MGNKWVLVIAIIAGSTTLAAQEKNPTATNTWPQNSQQPSGQTANGEPIYKITVVGRDIPAINYFHRGGATKVGFQGTSLLPQAKGIAEVASLNGRTEIKVHFEGLIAPNNFGIEYLTYVLWAITPQGRPENLGEVLWSHGKADTTVTTNLQAFGLILTAEPYFAVTMPSDLVIAQNYVIKDKTAGVLETVDAHYSLLPRGAYSETAGRHSVLEPITRKDRSPLELYEAINAVQIAKAGGAEQWAADSMATANQDLSNAEQMDIHQKHPKEEITYAREAVQTAEDARIMTIRKIKEHDEAEARQAAAAAQAQAQQQALAAQQQQQLAEAQANAAAAQAQAAQAAAEAARERQQTAEQAAQAAQQQTEQMREKLRDQLSQVLQTQETARGLIVNMPNVLFATNQYTLKPDAQIKLAKVSGILDAYPGLKVQVEGYTDSTGTADYNQKLSEKRAMAVQGFLTEQGVPPENTSAQGYGEADPIADNSTSEGRSQNRRVQLVISGASIGVQQQAPTQGNSQPLAQPANPTGVSNPPQPQR